VGADRLKPGLRPRSGVVPAQRGMVNNAARTQDMARDAQGAHAAYLISALNPKYEPKPRPGRSRGAGQAHHPDGGSA